MKHKLTKNNFIKNNWLTIIIILFTFFIIIPVVLKFFKINEGIDETVSATDTAPAANSESAADTAPAAAVDGVGTDIFNADLYTDIDFIKQLNENNTIIPLKMPNQQLNHNLYTIYNINKDLSNNVYRKSDSVTDISNNFYDKKGNNLLNTNYDYKQ